MYQKSVKDITLNLESIILLIWHQSRQSDAHCTKQDSELVVYLTDINISPAESIFEIWWELESHYSALAQMIKDFLRISVAVVEIE